MIDGERLKECIERARTTQSALAKAIGVSPQAISKMVVGGTAETPKIYKIARVLGTTPEYLTRESDEHGQNRLADRQLGYRAKEPDRRNDIVEIDEINVTFGMGGAFHDDALEVEKLPISRRLLARYTKSAPEKIFSAIGIGDSMYPTIHDRDLVFVDRSQNTIRMKDQIWALAQGEVGMIKRVRPMPDGSLKLLSDNPNVPDDDAFDGEVHVIGRVVAVLKSL